MELLQVTLDIDSVYDSRDSNAQWYTNYEVLNNGSGNKQPINYIKNKLNNNDQYIDVVRYNYQTAGFNPFNDLGISKIDVYAIDANGIETKVGEMSKEILQSLPYGTKGYRLQFPIKVPSDTVDLDQNLTLILSTIVF